MRTRSLIAAIPLGLCSALLLSCSDADQAPTGNVDGEGDFQGSVNPTAGSFVLTSIDSTDTDGGEIHVDLIGSNLTIDPATSEVSLDVAVRNAGDGDLYAPAEIIVHHLEPSAVWVTNSDRTLCARGTYPGQGGCWFGFDYSSLLGEDGMLSPGETSGAKRWRFQVPGLVGFSFGATAHFGLGPDRPRIAGVVFGDRNENGVREPDEPGFGGGHLEIQGPGLDSLIVQVPENGEYVIPVSESGLYHLLAVPPPTFAPVRSTTPNPLQIILPPGPGGIPESYLHADFGFANDFPPPPGDAEPVGFASDADSLILDPYSLLDIRLDGLILELRVGFSGCGDRHLFALYMVGGFMESNPVQAKVLLSHYDHGELCDAYFEKTLRYDLSPILREHYRQYGVEGVVIVNFQAHNGETHSFRIGGSAD